MQQQKEIPFSLYKEYLKTGVFPENLEIGDDPLDFRVAQALLLRRDAIVASDEDDTETASQKRSESRQVLRSPYNLVDSSIIESLFDFDTEFSMPEELSTIINFLKSDQIGYSKDGEKKLPVLSTIDPQILGELQIHFNLNLIPADQIEVTDFTKDLLSESEVPDWFKAILQNRNESEYVNIFDEIRQRWFLFVIVSLAVAAAAGFVFNWGIEIATLSKDFSVFLSVYGVAALGRATWQTARAEKWTKEARSYNRPTLIEGFAGFIEQYIETEDDKIFAEKIYNECLAIHDKNLGWEHFQVEVGLKQSKSATKQTPIQRYIDYLLDNGIFLIPTGTSRADRVNEIRDLIIDSIATRTFQSFKEKYGKEQPSVAFVIPTYQTPIDSMRGLLLSIKNQAYGKGNDKERTKMTAYVVYNDNPNSSDKKQVEYAEFQKLVTEMNATKGRNDCQIVLLEQPSRGKREAMAAGFVMAMGKSYFEDLDEKLFPEFAKQHMAKNPNASVNEVKTAFKEKMDTMIANFPISNLPDFKHDRIINIDSDTKIDGFFDVLNSELMMQENPNAGCITGDVRVETRNINLLTEMTFQRYWTAFFKERASQSLNGEVTCMSGPWVYMDSEKLGEILPMWYFFEHIAGRATFGDDREISTRMIELGYDSLFCPDSAVWTDCPETYEVWLKQQLRWNKSFTIYNMVLFNFLHKLDKFVQMDVVYQQTFPFAMLFIGSNILKEAVEIGAKEGFVDGATSTIPYAVIVFLFNELFFGVYGAVKNRVENEKGEFKADFQYLKSPVYIYYHFRYLLWTKLYSFYDLFYKGNTDWGTKGENYDDLFSVTGPGLDKMKNMQDEIADEIMQNLADGEIPQEEVNLEDFEDDDEYNGWFQGS